MARHTIQRLQDIREAIAHARDLMAGKSADDLASDTIVRAAFERFMEIVSEASRHVPGEMKARHPQIPWTKIAHFGNLLRQAYDSIDTAVLWQTYANDLTPLDAAVSDLIAQLQDGV